MTLNVLEVTESASRSLRPVGCVLLAVMTATLGAISIATGDFAYTWQPVPEGFPGREIAARITGLVLVVASALFVIPRTFRRSVIAMTLIFAAWLFVLHVPRLLSGENWLGSAELLQPLGACLALIGMIAHEPGSVSMPTWLTPDRAIKLGRMCFGVGLVGCGASHFVYAEFAAQMIPAWIPGRMFFTYLTGAGHIAAGLSLLTGVWMRPATALLCFMLACFVLLLHVPRVLADLDSRHEWTMLVVASLFNGAAWLMAAAVRSTRTSQSADRAVRDREPIAAG